jgi:hypothetical protein
MSEPSGEPQNIYDDAGFFAGYSTLERFGAGWERAMEHADLLALLPEVDGRRVLDLGCGAGSSHTISPRPEPPRSWESTCRSGCWRWRAPNGPIRV